MTRQRKRREDNIREWACLDFAKSQRAVENREKMEEREIICDASATLAVRGWMTMMMKCEARLSDKVLCLFQVLVAA